MRYSKYSSWELSYYRKSRILPVEIDITYYLLKLLRNLTPLPDSKGSRKHLAKWQPGLLTTRMRTGKPRSIVACVKEMIPPKP